MKPSRIVNYVGRVWNCRYFWLSLVQKDLQVRYRRSTMGIGWSLLQPIAMTTVLCVVFHQVFRIPALDYAVYLLAGLSFWNYFTATVMQGCQCIYQGEAYIRQYPAPLAIYPLRATLASGFHFLLALVVVVLLAWCTTGRVHPLALLTLVPTLLLLFVLGWSMAVLCGLANVHLPDSQHLADVALQIVFYTTPIIYPPAMLAENRVGWLLQYNPLGACVELIRAPIIDGQIPPISTFLFAATGTAAAALVASAALARLERRLVFYL